MKNNPVAPVTELTIDGATYSLLFDLESVALAEELTDQPLLTGLRQRDITAPKISLVRNMLFACLHPNHPDITLPQVKELVNRKNVFDIWSVILNCWTAGLAEPDPEEDAVEENPTTDQK